MRVLITNIATWPLSGTVTYVRDLAYGLQRRGWTPAVFSNGAGPLCDELRAAGIAVVSRLRTLPWRPDIIHGHHFLPLSSAVARWPGVPAIAICHDHTAMHDRTLNHPAVRRYFGVSEVCRRRLISEGVATDRAELLLNFVDVARCPPRAPLPSRPRRALVFSNYASDATHLPAVREACARAGLQLDVVGNAVGRHVAQPEQVLGEYDVVFAKAKAALEAMAVGTAVVLCDFAGVGPLVTSDAFDELRVRNFGYETLDSPLNADALLTQLARYDAEDAARVTGRIRSEASLETALDRLEAIYRECIDAGPAPSRLPWRMRMQQAGDRVALALYWRHAALPAHRHARLRGLRINPLLRRALARALARRRDR